MEILIKHLDGKRIIKSAMCNPSYTIRMISGKTSCNDITRNMKRLEIFTSPHESFNESFFYDAIRELKELGFIEEMGKRSYKLTEAGIRYAKENNLIYDQPVYD